MQLVRYRGWSPERAHSAERRYRRFFYLNATLPANSASPTSEVDEFWHEPYEETVGAALLNRWPKLPHS